MDSNSLWFGGTSEREVGLAPSDSITRVHHSKSAFWLENADIVLHEKTDVMALAEWLRYFVRNWGM